MNYLLEVCIVTLAVAISAAHPVAGQSLVTVPETPSRAVQTMQRGISVQLPVTRDAVPMPDADREDASIVTVPEDGSVYFGVDPMSPATLVDMLKNSLSNRTENKLYIKADARTQYSNVMKVLGTVHTAGVQAPNLLTAQPDSTEPGALTPPKGLAVLVGPTSPLGSETTVVQLLNSGQRRPTFRINDKQIPWANLRNALGSVLQGRGEKVVRLDAEATLPFADVVDVIDICRSMGTEVVLLVPEL
jgi:biopolymer transport protein TolR